MWSISFLTLTWQIMLFCCRNEAWVDCYYLSHTSSTSRFSRQAFGIFEHLKHRAQNFPSRDNGSGCLKHTFDADAIEISIQTRDENVFRIDFAQWTPNEIGGSWSSVICLCDPNMLMCSRPRAISKFSYEIRDKDANAAKGISTERRR
jgi:hypothetical protein